MEFIYNFLYEINVVKGLVRPRNSKEYKRYHELIAYKDNQAKSPAAEEIIIEYIKKNIKNLDASDLDTQEIGILILQCPEVLPYLVQENNLGVEEIKEICRSLQTNNSADLEEILKSVDEDKRNEFIKQAQQIEFEPMYILDRSDKQDRFKATISVSKEIIKEYIHRTFIGREERQQKSILHSLKNPDKTFIKNFLNWSADYVGIDKGAGQMEAFYTAHPDRFSEKMLQKMIQVIEKRRSSDCEKKKPRKLLSQNRPAVESRWFHNDKNYVYEEIRSEFIYLKKEYERLKQIKKNKQEERRLQEQKEEELLAIKEELLAIKEAKESAAKCLPEIPENPRLELMQLLPVLWIKSA